MKKSVITNMVCAAVLFTLSLNLAGCFLTGENETEFSTNIEADDRSRTYTP